MALCTAADVRLIMEPLPASVTDATVTAFINDCDILVTELLQPTGKLSTARLTAIEKYLAAHAVLMFSERGGLTSSRLSDAQDSYPNLITRAVTDRNGLQLTRYGQLAITFDDTKTLVGLSKHQLHAKFKVLTPSSGTGGHLDNPDPWWWLFW